MGGLEPIADWGSDTAVGVTERLWSIAEFVRLARTTEHDPPQKAVFLLLKAGTLE